MQFQHFKKHRVPYEVALRFLQTQPQNVKMRKALCNEQILIDFEVRSNLACIILKGYLSRNLKVHPTACGGSYLVL